MLWRATITAIAGHSRFRRGSRHQRCRRTDRRRRRRDARGQIRFHSGRTPHTGLHYRGVRSFAVQVRHIAASNWSIWSPLTGDKLPEGLKDDGNGPANLQTKADITKFLRDSFALGHRAAATLTTENMLQSPGNSKSTRLRLAEFGVAHAHDHYGQMVEYLRMNGIVPPASRPQSE